MVAPAVILAATQTALAAGRTGLKSGQKISSDVFSYDFVGLTTKLVIFFGAAYVITKVFESIINFDSTLRAILLLVGIKFPDVFPSQIVSFFREGIRGVKFWDIVKVLSILLVIMEWNNWNNTQKALGINPSPMTQGVFAVIVTGLVLITIPELFTRLKEMRIINQSMEESTNDFRQRDVR